MLLARVHGTTSSRASWTCQNTPGTSLCQFVQIDTHAHTHTAAHILQCSGTDIISFQAGIVATFHTLFCFVCNIGRQISSPAKTETSAIKKKNETWNNAVNCGNCVLERLSKFGHHFCCPSSFNTIFFFFFTSVT